MQGVIIEIGSNLYKAINKENGKIYELIPRGKLKKEEITPVVGDMVEFNNQGSIQSVLPRNVYIKRPKLANITQMILVVSSKDPKPDLLLLDKQIAFAEFLNVKVVIVLNKIDLDKKQQMQKIKEIYENIGYKVIETQAKEKFGIDELCYVISNNINAFSGNSGVGKSTLINGIFQKELTKEGEISQKNKRGKNTTTTIKLYEIEKNTYIADTPGFATFEISEIESKDLEKYFIEFRPFIKDCEFIGCTHIKEENCGIKQAVKEGKISLDRYERFCKIYEQLKEGEKRKW
ncbi:MAG: ribosome small subunit-dependent GTPase A [Clostridium sp. 27_14]|nr:MAG: ribosome small subunit-dependent GTPase A [Clostridium sp. 27_14]